jgi:hypothetical protein
VPETRGLGAFLAARRIRLSLAIAVVEGLLVVANVLPEWAVLVVAIAAVAYWVMLGRNADALFVRQGSWIFAASQAFVLLVPLAFIFFKTVAYVALAILVVVALVFLFTEREQHQS